MTVWSPKLPRVRKARNRKREDPLQARPAVGDLVALHIRSERREQGMRQRVCAHLDQMARRDAREFRRRHRPRPAAGRPKVSAMSAHPVICREGRCAARPRRDAAAARAQCRLNGATSAGATLSKVGAARPPPSYPWRRRFPTRVVTVNRHLELAAAGRAQQRSLGRPTKSRVSPV